MAEQLNVGDVVATLRGVTTNFQRAMADASQRLQQLGQQAQQTQQQFSSLSFQAVSNAIDQFSRSTKAAGNDQAALRAAITQAQTAMQQFGVTTSSSGAMVDKFGAQLNKAAAEQLRGFATGIREAQGELAGLQRFGIDAGKSLEDVGHKAEGMGTMLRTALAVAGGIGLATSITGIVSALKNMAAESLALAAKSQDLHLAFRAIEGSAAAANRTLTFLFNTSQRLGVDFQVVAEGFKRMDQAAKGTSLAGDGIARVFANVVAGARTLGVSSEQTSQAIVALEQILTKGKLSAEEYRRQLGNAIPGALQLMSSGLGVTTRQMEDMIALGIIPAETALISLGNAMGALRGKSGVETVEQLSGTFARLKNESTAWMTAMGTGVAEIIQPFLRDVLKLSEAVRALFNIKPPGVSAPAAIPPGFGPLGFGESMPGPLPSTGAVTATGQAGSGVRPQPFLHSAYDALIQQNAIRIGEEPGLLARLIREESRFDPTARGRMVPGQGQALGLGGIMPATGRDYKLLAEADFFDPEKNITASANIFRDYRKTIRDKFGVLTDETRLTLAAYNAGIGNVMTALAAATAESQKQGTAVTFGNVVGRLTGRQETRPYVERIAGPYIPATGTVGAAAVLPTGKDDPLAPMLKRASEVADTLTTIQKSMEATGRSGLNTGDVLGKQLQEQADIAIKKYGEVGSMLAAFPQLFARMQPAQREVVALAGEMAAKFGEEGKVRDILKAQAEALEQLTLRRRADLVILEQGQAAGERFLRAETQAMALRRTHEDATRVVGTGAQEIARYQAQIAALTTQADALGREVEGRKPDPEKLAQIKATGQAQIAAIEGEIAAYTALQALTARYTQPKEETDLHKAILLADKVTLGPLKADAEAMLNAIKDSATVLEQVPALEAAAASSRLQFQQSQVQEATLQRERDRLEQLQTPQQQTVFDILTGTPSRADLKQRQKDDQLLRTTQAKDEAIQIRAAIAAQERLNYLLSVSDQLASTAAQSWVTGLQGIIAGTQSVAQAFKAMVASVLQSLGQIAAQESFRALFRLGVGLVAGSLTGGAGAGDTSGQMDAAQAFAASFQGHAGGGMVNQPTRILAGESAATNPEWIVNHPQMQSLLAAAVQRAPSAGGQAIGGNVTVINVATPQQAEAEAAKARARGDEVILNTIMRDVQRGEASQLVRTLRTLQR